LAGIGFELKKLFKATGVLSILRAYGYTGMITAGPMLLGILFLLGINGTGKAFGLDKNGQDLLVCMITYSLLGSIMLTSACSMVVTRYIADMLYQEHEERILPSLEGICSILLPPGAVISIIFLAFAGISHTLIVLNFILFMELTVVWMEMNYLTAIKNYQGILLSYVFAIVTSFCAAYLGCVVFGVSDEVLMAAVCIGYGIMMCMDMILLYRFFPSEQAHFYEFLHWFDEFQSLALIGLFTNIGLFSHLVIAWMSKIGEQVQGLYYGAPQHDVAALFAFITILMTTINFVASVEVNFYPKYRAYYDLFNGTGSIMEIEQAEKEMLTVLDHELTYTARKQFYLTAVMLSLGLVVLNRLPLGFDAMMEGYFRILCIGYGAYAIGNVLMLILLYFTDYEGARAASAIFALSTTAGCILSLFLNAKYYGFAFAIGSMLYFGVCWFRLNSYTQKLPYHILSTQPIVAVPRYGFFSKISDLLEHEGGTAR
jgi:uncharacterized membrane protein